MSTKNDILNFVFPHVAEVIKRYNSSELCRFIIKGGASIKYFLESQHRKQINDITYDIDISPILKFDLPNFGGSYINKCIECNKHLANGITKKLIHEARINRFNIEVNTNEWNGLITIQVKLNDGQFYDIIDLSYIDVNDDDSFFINAVKKYYPTFVNYAKHIFDDNIMFTEPLIECHMAKSGIERNEEYLQHIPDWRRYIEIGTREIFRLTKELQNLKNQQLELFGIGFEDEQSHKLKYQIESTQYLVNQYIKQTSPEYIAKMQDKINRYKKKLEMLYEVGITC